MSYAYLVALLFSIFGMAMLDYRYKLAFFRDAKRTGKTIATAVILFLAWDLLGIGFGIFFVCPSEYTTGLLLLPELPLEELFFLFFLCYITLISYEGASRYVDIYRTK